MSNWRKATVLAALFLLLFSAASAEEDGQIRVKLTRLGTPARIEFVANCDYATSEGVRIPSGSTVTVLRSGNGLTAVCGSARGEMGASFSLKRLGGADTGARFALPAMANRFCGDLYFSTQGAGVGVVLEIPVEEYLLGVVGYEMSDSYPIEALKAQAVAARTYALRAKSARKGREYHVTDNTGDQVFKGLNSSQKNVRRAVTQSGGVVLTYKGKLAACYYGASNGGQTESTGNIWGSNLPYSRVQDDPYDLQGGGYSRSVSFARDLSGAALAPEMEQALKQGVGQALSEKGYDPEAVEITLLSIDGVTPTSPKYAAPSRLYRKLIFQVTARVTTAAGEQAQGGVEVEIPTYGGLETWYGLSLNRGDNETISVEEANGRFTVTFRRYGHGVGMSQRGAKVMAGEYGKSAREILEFYYPGTELKKLAYAEAADTPLPTEAPLPAATPDAWEFPEIEATPAPAATDPPETIQPVESVQAWVKLQGGTLNFRSAPSVSGRILGSLKNGEQVTVTALEGAWARIQRGGREGYVMARYLTLEKPAPALPEADSSVYARVRLEQAGAVLRLRDAPGGNVIARLKNGAFVRVIALKGQWARVETASGKQGYLAKGYLERVYADWQMEQTD